MTALRRAAALIALGAIAAGCGAASEPGGDPRSLERYGIRIEVPDRWHARLTRGTVEAANSPLAFPRPQPQLADEDVLVHIFEFEPDPNHYGAAEFEETHAEGTPRPFTVDEFGPPEFGGDNPGNHGFARRNFAMAGRYFDLFVESGRLKPPARAVSELNELVASLEVREGDFYPGTIRPPRFSSAPGWHVGSGDGGEVRTTDYSEAWASTVAYLNGLRDLPPAKTLETLQEDGILIWIGLARDNRFPPTSELRRRLPTIDLPLTLAQMDGGVGWEGQVRDVSLYRLHGLVEDRFHVDVWVFFGGGEPTAAQRDRAQAMFDRLDLPDWGSWELDSRSAVELPALRD